MKKKNIALSLSLLALCGGVAAADSNIVKVTPLGSHDGEFCAADRALIFEDPDGTRILYDAGRTVRGGADPRLGKIDAVLLSHVHSDHLGDAHQAAPNAGTCAAPDFSVKDTPSSITEEVVLAKKARLVVGGEMGSFFTPRLKAGGGSADQVRIVRFGAQTKIGGVAIASVPAAHTNGLEAKFLDPAHAAPFAENGLTAYVGPAGGYVLTFSNGLAVYLSGDTGIIADQDLVVRRFYKPKLAVMNIGGGYTTGPVESAYVINELVQPNAVIASHVNEAATRDGKLLAGKTMEFKNAVKVPVYAPLSGRTMSFNSNGICVAGCE